MFWYWFMGEEEKLKDGFMTFSEELATLIFKHHPKALQGDAEALGQVSGAMATTFGGLLAFSLRFNGKDHTLFIIRHTVKKMLEQGGMVDMKVENILREKG